MFVRTYVKLIVPTLAAVLLLADCSTGAKTPTSSSSQSVTASTTTKASQSSPPTPNAEARCGSKRVQSLLRQITGPSRARLPVLDVGQGSTVAVFLHQTDGDGLCGWWPFAAWLTAHVHVRAVLVDLCGYGNADCPPSSFAEDQKAQVALAVQHARTAATRRVVLVGASMGGALALGSATAVHADAVVDLSGPADWTNAKAGPAARLLRVPCLIAVSPRDPDASYTDLKAAFATIPASPKKFVSGDGGHGWDLLSDTTAPLATTVAHWIAGTYT
ncbi:MAG: hypothetical protein DLM57_16105 [Pseudonocardiales bacterium]|nr:MAG: hypothetical protein DLM57_16105 [Pseudonocardiales bacterium]